MADYAIHEETLVDVSNVIRKKDGTSALIDPADYADRINLMGMLEEKTVSGAIATFADGADDVPLKKCEITLPASLSGYSSVDVKHTKKNLLPNTAQTATENDVTYTVNSDGSVSLSGTCSADTNFYIYSGFTFPKLGQYFFSGCPSGGSTSTYRVFLTNYGADVGNGYLLNVSNLSTTTSVRINIKAGTVTDGLVFKPQIEAGSTATTYEPYTTPTTHTASLGRTIHGGKVDAVNGEGESKCGKVTFDGSENWVEYAGGNGYLVAVADMERGTWYTSEFAESSPLPKVPDNSTLGVRIGVNNNGIYVVQANTIEGVTDLASFKAYLSENPLTIIYPLATPTDFTFEPVPIDSKLGNNTIWSEQGSAEVTYRSSGTVYQYPEGEGVSF